MSRPECTRCGRPLYLIHPDRRLCAVCSPVKAILTPATEGETA